MLDESQHAQSNAGSHVSGTGGHARLGSQGRRDPLGVSGSHADFERADEELDLEQEYDAEGTDSADGDGGTGSDDDGDGGGSLYQPTLIAKTKPGKAKKKKA